jgi:hypothetical protein
MSSSLHESCEETEDGDRDVVVPKIIKVVSLAPTAEQEEFDDDKDEGSPHPVNGNYLFIPSFLICHGPYT